MKKNYYFIVALFLIFQYIGISNSHAFSLQQLWTGKSEKRAITDLKAIDINKNGIKELVVVCNYAMPLEKYAIQYGSYGYVKLYEWDGNSLIKKWDQPEITKSISVLVVKSGGQEFLEVGTFSLNELLFKDKTYILKKLDKSSKLSWPNEEPVAIGSFKDKKAKNIILTAYKKGKRQWHPRFRDAKEPNKVLWTSELPIGVGAVQLFGDFDNDKKLELLLFSISEIKGYWISPKDNEFEVKEIKSRRTDNFGYILSLFPLYPDPNIADNLLKAGRTTLKDFDEVFFIDPSVPFSYGGLSKATWQKDRFEFQTILEAERLETNKGAIGYENLNLADMDNDGLDEIIISEIKGDLVFFKEGEGDEPDIKNHRDVIHILKWAGKEYKKIWSSQPLGEITQMLINDITGDGKKEIIAGNGKGEIYIFGQK